MSLNITVNGKFTSTCRKDCILSESDRIKKDLEDERRILRLQQVREESKNLAAKIRKDVAEEKERQLRKLEVVKAQELNCWREHVLAQKHQDYRNAIFQVGTAHNAAKAENASIAAHERERQRKLRQLKARKFIRNEQQKTPTKTNVDHANNQNNKTVCSPPKIHAKQTKKKTTPMKRKHQSTCTHGKSCCLCSDKSGGAKEAHAACSDSSLTDSTIDCTIYDDSDSEAEAPATKSTQTACGCTGLHQTPAVLLEVKEDSDESVTVTAPTVVKDKHVKTNRQFTRIVNKSPEKSTRKEAQKKPLVTPIAKDERTTQSDPICKPPRKRFTNISDILKNKKPMVTREKSPRKESANPATVTQPPNSPRKVTTPRKSCGKSSAGVSTATTTAQCGTVDSKGGSAGSGRVQFYDYNNKFAKEYAQPAVAARVRPQDHHEHDAMQQAAIENRLQEARAQEMEKLRKKSDERGRKAIEREQVRRDCHELTEKLETLTRQQPQLLPSNANLYASHQYAEKAARKETKMNTAVEGLLMRPAIITCPPVRTQKTPARVANPAACMPSKPAASDLNVGSANAANNNSSSDSCCSILLGYVNDQSKQIRNDINECEMQPNDNQDKAERLKQLLERIELLRQILLKELESQNTLVGAGEQVQQVIDSISSLRKEREHILVDDVKKGQVLLRKREKELMQKEAILEQKLREFYNLQKGVCGEATTSSKAPKKKRERTVQTSADKPVEIIISLKEEQKQPPKTPKKPKGKSPRKVSTLMQSPLMKRIAKKKNLTTVKQKLQAEMISRRSSYDSNSTAYRSLPSALANEIEELVEQFAHGPDDHSTDKCSQDTVEPSKTMATTSRSQSTRLNPQVAHYVQRLLGMSRNSIKCLGVSSSSIDTPSSSVINTTANMGADTTEYHLSPERLKRIQSFIEENRSFIHDLEESMRTQSNNSLETSWRLLEEIWKQQLSNKGKTKAVKPPKEANKPAAPKPQLKPSLRKKEPKQTGGGGCSERVIDKRKTQSDEAQGKKSDTAQPKSLIRPVPVRPTAAVQDKNVATQQNESNGADQMARYAKLTENCTQRIGELSELINKVRQEKQRLLERTFSSVSDNERNSTEYFEIPDLEGAQAGQRGAGDSSSESSQSKLLDSNEPKSESTEQLPPESVPLEKHKQTGRSHDSGISMSRPITAQEQHHDMEPLSLSSSHTSSTSHRKAKPPPTLRRFSPQLLEEEMGHELSTILEVDTPATSRISVQQPATKPTDETRKEGQQPPMAFPTFEQYAQQLNLDCTQLDPETSLRLQTEYNELVTALQQDCGLRYEEFPSLTAYLQNITASERGDVGRAILNEHSMDSLENLLSALRLAHQPAMRSFPTQKEYMQRLTTNSPVDMIDTESLENLSNNQTPAETDSETINIEEELKRRNLLKHSFRTKPQSRQHCSTNAPDDDEVSRVYAHLTAGESGIEKLSSSENLSGSLERELFQLGMKWPTTMRRKAQESRALSSSSSTTVTLNTKTQSDKKAVGKSKCPAQCAHTSCNRSCNDMGQPMNLREFLTKELLKHAATTSGSSSLSTENSLRSNFFQSILDSMSPTGSPRTNPAASSGINTNPTNIERQKTSTPVNSRSTHSHSRTSHKSQTSSVHLFSGESRLSSVYFQDCPCEGSVRGSTNDKEVEENSSGQQKE